VVAVPHDAQTFLEGLRGRQLLTLTNRNRNVVLDVSPEGALVATASSPKGELIPLGDVQAALDRLARERELVVNVEGLESHRSSFIGAALATLPNVSVSATKPRRLTLTDDGDPVAAELALRMEMWYRLADHGGPRDVTKRLIRELGIYGGAQGVWVDSDRTRAVARNGAGVAIGLLHTGRHYADDLSPTGILYHYPRTNRQSGRDASEIQATKNAADFALPVFVITASSKSSARRDVHLGWVVDSDDDSEIFLVTFTDGPALAATQDATGSAAPFALFDESAEKRRVEVAARPNQQRFKFEVIARYGAACAVCDIEVLEVLDAVHIAEKRVKGSDDPANGLVLCATHHRAFDRGLFCINPDDLTICTKLDALTLRLTRRSITHLEARPHTDALSWRWLFGAVRATHREVAERNAHNGRADLPDLELRSGRAVPIRAGAGAVDRSLRGMACQVQVQELEDHGDASHQSDEGHASQAGE
jgi:putative restriction endonuclease